MLQWYSLRQSMPHFVAFEGEFCAMSFGSNLKSLRCAKLPPLTQTDLANAIGVTQRKISFLETGASEPSLRDIAALCRYFNVSADYFLGLPRDMEYPDTL